MLAAIGRLLGLAEWSYWDSRPDTRANAQPHDTCITTRRHSEGLNGTQRNSIRPAQAADQHFRFAITRRRSQVRNLERPRNSAGQQALSPFRGPSRRSRVPQACHERITNLNDPT
jgi:hypothetical protein